MRIESSRARSVVSPFHSHTPPAGDAAPDRVAISAGEPEAKKRGLVARIGGAALAFTALAGGLGLLAGTAPPAQAYTVYQTCLAGQVNPYRFQDTEMLGHMATLFASPNTAFNHAAGLYDGSHIFSPSGDFNRLDGTQAYKQLSCYQAVRFFSPQTGWLTFHSLDQLHSYIGLHGTPWDVPGLSLSDRYTAHFGDPWYDPSTVPYNSYHSYGTWSTPSWTYVPPPAYNGTQAPPDYGTSVGGSTQAPTDPDWHPTAPSGGGWSQTPGANWNQGAPSGGQAPADF
ncbi:MAG: hypothetical protein ACYCW6_27835 [Candidatus Xenobia bacterium]